MASTRHRWPVQAMPLYIWTLSLATATATPSFSTTHPDRFPGLTSPSLYRTARDTSSPASPGSASSTSPSSTPNRTVLILALTLSLILAILLGGLIENYLAFRRLCRGERTRRGMPVCWMVFLPIVSCTLVPSSGYFARADAEQAALRARWAGLSLAARLRSWARWGFRLRYPPFLGAAPRRYPKTVDEAITLRARRPRHHDGDGDAFARYRSRHALEFLGVHRADDTTHDPPPPYAARDTAGGVVHAVPAPASEPEPEAEPPPLEVEPPPPRFSAEHGTETRT